MKDDKIIIKEWHRIAARDIFGRIKSEITDKYTMTVGGESGAGKSEVAFALLEVLEENGFSVERGVGGVETAFYASLPAANTTSDSCPKGVASCSLRVEGHHTVFGPLDTQLCSRRVCNPTTQGGGLQTHREL